MSTTTDAELVTSFLSGDRGALAGIYDRYAAGLFDTAAAMLSDRHDAADMVQDVFCIAAERLGQLRDPERLKPWLYAVLRNEVYRRTKKRRRALPTDFTAEGVPDVVAPHDPGAEGESIAYDELASLVRSAAAGLDERDQLVLELSVRQGLSGADLADALGVTPEQSYSMVHRMRERVDKSIGAFVVARTGRKDCATLAEILRGWDGEFNVLVRKRVARHVESCSVCERKRTAVAPLALFAAAPVFILPIGLRERVLAAATPGAAGPSRTPHSSRRMRFNRHDGFPRAARLTRHAMAWTAGATAAVVIGAATLVLVNAGGDESSTPGDPVVTAVDSVPGNEPTTIGPSSTDATVISDVTAPADAATSTTVASSSTSRPATVQPTTRPSTVATSIAASPAATPTTSSPASPTSPASNVTATTRPIGTTTTTTSAPRYTGAFLALNATALPFSTDGTTRTIVLTNPSPGPVTWIAQSPSTAAGFFTFSPASGSLRSGASVKVTVTFNRVLAAGYSNTGAFPETADFAHTAAFTGQSTGQSLSGQATTVSVKLTGRVARPPLVRDAVIGFSGQACINAKITVRAADESGVKSVVGTATLVNNDGTTAARSLVFTNQGDKIGWVATVGDLLAKTVAINVSATATDNLGLTTPVTASQKRPTTC